MQYGREVFTIELIELGNDNFVNPDNMQIEIFNNRLPTNKFIENFFETKGINFKDFH